MELSLTPEAVAGREFFRGEGCDHCHGSGYKGRMGIFEIMVMDDEIRDLVMEGASTAQIRDLARRHGMSSLRESGLRGIYDGLTTIDEVVRETIEED